MKWTYEIAYATYEIAYFSVAKRKNLETVIISTRDIQNSIEKDVY